MVDRINEKNEMGFSEYLNALYKINYSFLNLEQVKLDSLRILYENHKEFYKKQANSLEKALEIEHNPLIKTLKNEYVSGDYRFPGDDLFWIGFFLHDRHKIIDFFHKGTIIWCAGGLSQDEIDEYFMIKRNSERALLVLLEEKRWYDKYIWKKLTGKPWVEVPLENLRKEFDYPKEREHDFFD